MALSALDDRTQVPTAALVAAVLGPSVTLWHDLVARMHESYGASSEEWAHSGAKYGWIAKIKAKKRPHPRDHRSGTTIPGGNGVPSAGSRTIRLRRGRDHRCGKDVVGQGGIRG